MAHIFFLSLPYSHRQTNNPISNKNLQSQTKVEEPSELLSESSFVSSGEISPSDHQSMEDSDSKSTKSTGKTFGQVGVIDEYIITKVIIYC